jgi:hypothetical protein
MPRSSQKIAGAELSGGLLPPRSSGARIDSGLGREMSPGDSGEAAGAFLRGCGLPDALADSPRAMRGIPGKHCRDGYR